MITLDTETFSIPLRLSTETQVDSLTKLAQHVQHADKIEDLNFDGLAPLLDDYFQRLPHYCKTAGGIQFKASILRKAACGPKKNHCLVQESLDKASVDVRDALQWLFDDLRSKDRPEGIAISCMTLAATHERSKDMHQEAKDLDSALTIEEGFRMFPSIKVTPELRTALAEALTWYESKSAIPIQDLLDVLATVDLASKMSRERYKEIETACGSFNKLQKKLHTILEPHLKDGDMLRGLFEKVGFYRSRYLQAAIACNPTYPLEVLEPLRGGIKRDYEPLLKGFRDFCLAVQAEPCDLNDLKAKLNTLVNLDYCGVEAFERITQADFHLTQIKEDTDRSVFPGLILDQDWERASDLVAEVRPSAVGKTAKLAESCAQLIELAKKTEAIAHRRMAAKWPLSIREQLVCKLLNTAAFASYQLLIRQLRHGIMADRRFISLAQQHKQEFYPDSFNFALL
ncbi:MAG: hypothetical protein KDK78_00815 [Chlamydiia bacterium]|nr:hypothetical protein [Chlamydiia bacterium]